MGHATSTNSRRAWLGQVGSALGVLGISGKVLGAHPGFSAFAPFRVGIQSYSLRHYDAPEAMDWTQKLGLRYWESYSKHVPTKKESVAEAKAAAKQHEITINGYGVLHFTKDERANRELFEFGKALGIKYFSADPDEDAFDCLDKLVDEYKIAIGIHNHGPGHKWAKIATIRDAIKDHHALIGCCVDTGHFLRSMEDPVDAVEAFAGRVYGVHLKDVKNATQFTVLGKGDLRTADLLALLAKQKYDYCLALEYEESEQDPIADIKACLKALDEAMPKG